MQKLEFIYRLCITTEGYLSTLGGGWLHLGIFQILHIFFTCRKGFFYVQTKSSYEADGRNLSLTSYQMRSKRMWRFSFTRRLSGLNPLFIDSKASIHILSCASWFFRNWLVSNLDMQRHVEGIFMGHLYWYIQTDKIIWTGVISQSIHEVPPKKVLYFLKKSFFFLF